MILFEKYTGKRNSTNFLYRCGQRWCPARTFTELYKNIIAKFRDLHFIASGGVVNLDDVYQLQDIGCKGVIIGKAIYEGVSL